MNYDYTKARAMVADLIDLCNRSSADAFKNGVTDESGSTDEGDVKAEHVLEDARQFLRNNHKLFDVDDLIFYLRDNRVHSAPVLSRQIVSVRADIMPSTAEQVNLFTPFGPEGARYMTCHGIVLASEAFATRNELADSLRRNPSERARRVQRLR